MAVQCLLTIDPDNYLSSEVTAEINAKLDDAGLLDADGIAAPEIDLLTREGFPEIARQQALEARLATTRAVANDLGNKELCDWQQHTKDEVPLGEYKKRRMPPEAAKAIIAFRNTTGVEDIVIWPGRTKSRRLALGDMAVGVLTVSDDEKYYFPISRWGKRLNSMAKVKSRERFQAGISRAGLLLLAVGLIAGLCGLGYLMMRSTANSDIFPSLQSPKHSKSNSPSTINPFDMFRDVGRQMTLVLLKYSRLAIFSALAIAPVLLISSMFTAGRVFSRIVVLLVLVLVTMSLLFHV